MLKSNSKSQGNPRSQSWRNKRLQWEGLAENEGFKPVMKEWVGDGKLIKPYKILQLNALHNCHQHLEHDKNTTTQQQSSLFTFVRYRTFWQRRILKRTRN